MVLCEPAMGSSKGVGLLGHCLGGGGRWCPLLVGEEGDGTGVLFVSGNLVDNWCNNVVYLYVYLNTD